MHKGAHEGRVGKPAWIQVLHNIGGVDTATLVADRIFEDFKLFRILALNKMFLRT